MMRLIILLLLVSFSVSGQPKIINDTGMDNDFYKTITKMIAYDLALNDANIEVVVSNSKNTGNHYAVMVRHSEQLFVIDLDIRRLTRNNKARVFIHEMVHVSQMYNKRLRALPGAVWFEGELYTNDTPYNRRGYEIEAMRLEDRLFNKYIK